jgi:hypothetical protein
MLHTKELSLLAIRPLKKNSWWSSPPAPWKGSPAPKILFFILKNPAKKRFNIDYYGPLVADSSTSLVLTKFSLLRPSAPLSIIIEVEIAYARWHEFLSFDILAKFWIFNSKIKNKKFKKSLPLTYFGEWKGRSPTFFLKWPNCTKYMVHFTPGLPWTSYILYTSWRARFNLYNLEKWTQNFKIITHKSIIIYVTGL